MKPPTPNDTQQTSITSSSTSTTSSSEKNNLLNGKTSPPPDFNQTFIDSSASFHELGHNDSMHSGGTDSIQTTTTVDESLNSNRIDNSGRFDDISGVTSLGDTSGDDQSYIPEYPPVKSKEVHFEAGVHYFEDGNFWMEVPGLMESEVEDEDDELDYPILVKKNTKVKFR